MPLGRQPDSFPGRLPSRVLLGPRLPSSWVPGWTCWGPGAVPLSPAVHSLGCCVSGFCAGDVSTGFQPGDWAEGCPPPSCSAVLLCVVALDGPAFVLSCQAVPSRVPPPAPRIWRRDVTAPQGQRPRRDRALQGPRACPAGALDALDASCTAAVSCVRICRGQAVGVRETVVSEERGRQSV